MPDYNVFSTDLIDRGFASENCGLEFDFLSQNYTTKTHKHALQAEKKYIKNLPM